MKSKTTKSDQWFLPTSITLVLLVLLYFFVLFPKDVTTVFFQYITYVVFTLIAVLIIILVGLLYLRKAENNSAKKAVDTDKNEQKVEHLIWRNRYVLQASRSRIQSSPTDDAKELWLKEKAIFSKKYIFPVIPEEVVPFHEVSELIEKSLRGAAIGGIRPPTYNVRHE